jgi:hypothetical protein
MFRGASGIYGRFRPKVIEPHDLHRVEGFRQIAGPNPMHVTTMIDQEARGLDRTLG